ncbi:DNA-directed RNA polymerase sigma-70 factor [Bryobacterales bacterium F-183]|nr:DNA-directed RNA polymerase sigma-70 factor [Bryobacterales bacterium F-183]
MEPDSSSSDPTGTVTKLIRASSLGDSDARERLIAEIYADLHRIAARMMSRERAGHTLQATALVNEVLLKFLIKDDPFAAENKKQLMSIAAISMRHMLVDHARAKGRAKRGGPAEQIPIQTELDGVAPSSEKLLLINDALRRLEQKGERHARVAELRIFGGFTTEEIAEVLNVATRTVERDWLFARAWLQNELK